MSTPSALKSVSAPIADLKPRSLILSGAGIVPLGFVAQGDGTVVVKWSSPLDPDNPTESLPVKNGAQYPGQIESIISSDVDLLFYFGDSSAGSVHVGGGISSGGGGGGDASAANQVLGLTALDDIYDALVLVGTEATSADILAAVNSLGDGATLADLATALTPLASAATEATQQDVLAALETQGIDIGLIQTNVALLVPDVDAMRISLVSIDGKTPASPAQDRTTFGAPSAVRIVDAGASAFVTPFVSGDSVAQSGTWNITNISGTVSLPTGAATATLQGAGLPAAFGAGGGVKIDGSGTALPVSGTVSVTGVAAAAAFTTSYSVPTTIPVNALGGVYTGSVWTPMRGDSSNGLIVQGGSSVASASSGYPFTVAISDTGGNTRRMAGDTTGRPRMMLVGSAPHADATTDVYTRFPTLGTAYTAFTSGVAVLKATAGRVRQLHIHYDGGTGSGLYVQLHNAATATTPTDSTWVMAWPINSSITVVDFLSQIDIPCTAGIKLAFSSTRFTYTAATSETGGAVGWGA